jgi:hypothetical protein
VERIYRFIKRLMADAIFASANAQQVGLVFALKLF